MLAGLLFADHEALDRPGQLTATLPFGGTSLIEYQARLLIGAGASQLIVSVGKLTPELLGALGRIGRRGVAIDAVRSAGEAAEKLHPLSRVLLLGDGLITTQDIVDHMAGLPNDALLVLPEGDAPAEYERLGGRMAWAGVARLDPRRIGEVAALPRDYDLQSTVLRLAEQARADHLALPPGALHDGHGIEHSSTDMAQRARAVLAATVADRRNGFTTAIAAPLARAAVPPLVHRGVPSAAVMAAGAVLGLGGILAMLMAAAPATGMVMAFAAGLTMGLAGVVARLRDEAPLERAAGAAEMGIAAAATLALGVTDAAILALPMALMLVFMGGVATRAVRRRHRRAWWGTPPAWLLVLTGFTLAGHAEWGLAAALLYAAATLVAAVEALRREA